MNKGKKNIKFSTNRSADVVKQEEEEHVAIDEFMYKKNRSTCYLEEVTMEPP